MFIIYIIDALQLYKNREFNEINSELKQEEGLIYTVFIYAESRGVIFFFEINVSKIFFLISF